MKPKQELKIFKATSIELLKKLYYKSKSYLTENKTWDVVTDRMENESKRLGEIPILKKSLNKIETELKIFRKVNIETLKTAYYETSLDKSGTSSL